MPFLRPHLLTLAPWLRSLVRPVPLPPPRAWSTTVEDADVGPVRLTGELREVEGARRVFVLVHGLGGSPRSYYVREAARDLAVAGASTLALSLRGSDGLGEDFYNVALTADLHATVGSELLARYESVHVVGFSMGGYVALHYAAEAGDARLASVAAVCTPLDLAAAQRWIDAPAGWPYRTHVLGGLKRIYAAVAARRPVPTDPRRVAAVRTIREWDRLAIVPRYGFASPEDYYRRLSVVPRLGHLRVPALLVCAGLDPVVPPATVRPFVPRLDGERGAGGRLSVAWSERAGHLAFPRERLLATDAGPELGDQLAAWLADPGPLPPRSSR